MSGGENIPEKIRQMDRALDIAAEMFSKEGYVDPRGDGSPSAIRRFLMKKARDELYGLEKRSPRALR